MVVNMPQYKNNNLYKTFFGVCKKCQELKMYCKNKKADTKNKQTTKMNMNMIDSFKVTKTLPDAIIPSKPHVTDIGFDLTVIKKLKTIGDVTFYDSGIAITPSLGYFCMLAPRSSISKSGYMLANSVGIIDPSYTGNFIVALRKVDKDADDITLPCRIAQIIPQRAYYPEFVNVERLDETTRGSGGFGSSGN